MAEALKITSQDALSLGVVDEIVAEPLGGAHRNVDLTARNVKVALIKHLDELEKIKTPRLIEKRYEKFRAMGRFVEKEIVEAVAEG
jgi:acetyl-CoA carboxylase carboxyl transferase subunit alpha